MLLLNLFLNQGVVFILFLFVKVFRDIKKLDIDGKTVVTTGTFDGVHIGHQQVVKSLIQSAKKNNCESVLLTFDPHPRIVLQQNTDLKLLSTLDEKITLLKECGIDNLLVIPFTKEFSRMTSLEFVREIIVKELDTEKLIIGYDHHFGRNREGSFEHLKEFGPVYGFDVEEIPAKDVEEVRISSTKIREALEEGDVKMAAKLLGHPYQMSGVVVKGNQIGGSLGFPTANIKISDQYKLIPKKGAYAVELKLDDEMYVGMMNIGVRPTIDDKQDLSIEVHVLDYKGDLYGEKISLLLVDRLRNEKMFDSREQLVEQLKRDEVNCRKVFHK